MLTFNVFAVTFVDVLQMARVLIPPLHHASHKGAMGRVGVFGGSRDYTGAPYYAATSALKFGADLSFVFCSELASTPIKCYSPELMITPVYRDAVFDERSRNYHHAASEEEINRAASLVGDSMTRLHSLVVGPGMGRQDHVLAIAEQVVKRARQNKRQ